MRDPNRSPAPGALTPATARLRELDLQDRELFRLFVDSVQDYAIFMLDPAGFVATWNAGAQRIKGYHGAEIIGRHFSTSRTSSRSRQRSDGSRTRAGACARTAASSGRTW